MPCKMLALKAKAKAETDINPNSMIVQSEYILWT